MSQNNNLKTVSGLGLKTLSRDPTNREEWSAAFSFISRAYKNGPPQWSEVKPILDGLRTQIERAGARGETTLAIEVYDQICRVCAITPDSQANRYAQYCLSRKQSYTIKRVNKLDAVENWNLGVSEVVPYFAARYFEIAGEKFYRAGEWDKSIRSYEAAITALGIDSEKIEKRIKLTYETKLSEGVTLAWAVENRFFDRLDLSEMGKIEYIISARNLVSDAKIGDREN